MGFFILSTVAPFNEQRRSIAMTEDLLDYWLRLITPIFPKNAWIVSSLSDGNHLIQIDWKLENDPHQPNKRSRKIQITISEKAIDHYLDKNKTDRELSDINLKKSILERYNSFDPDYDAQTTKSVATARWLISREVLNG
jgi:hypothetical protein